MGEEYLPAGDHNSHGSQYTSYPGEADVHGQDRCADGGYFNDGYSVETQSYEGSGDPRDANEYGGYPPVQDRGTMFCHR